MKFRQLAAWGIFWGSAVVLSTSALVYAFNPQPDPPGHYYGLMTLPGNRSVSLHVSNVRPPVTEITTARRAVQVTCVADLQFIDAQGRLLARRQADIDPSDSFSLNFTIPPDTGHPPDPGLPPGPCHVDPTRAGGVSCGTEVRAQVVFTGPAGHCVSSLEVGDPFVGDPTGLRAAGAFVHPGMIVGFNPQPDPPKVAK